MLGDKPENSCSCLNISDYIYIGYRKYHPLTGTIYIPARSDIDETTLNKFNE